MIGDRTVTCQMPSRGSKCGVGRIAPCLRDMWYESAVNPNLIVRLYRVIFGLLALGAIGTQVVSLMGKPTFNPVSFFSYFTIDSNLIAAVVLLVLAARSASDRPVSLDLLRGGAVVYMSVTGVVFTLLLAGTDVDTAIPWVNTVVHELMPLVLVADWLIDPPVRRLTMRQGLVWLSFPLAWIVYTLIRGSITELYPYPFLNPANGGYASVAAYSVGIFVLMTGICAVVAWLGNRRDVEEPVG
jgi:hypothetical protein